MTTENTVTPPVVQPQTVVSIRRILLAWSYADDTPFTPDDVDRIIDVAMGKRVRKS